MYALIRNPKSVSIYNNKKRAKSVGQVRAYTGCDLVINGGLYDLRTGKPACHLRIDGQTIASEDWTRPGFGWNSGTANLHYVQANTMGDYNNFIDCVEIVHDKKPCALSYPSDMGGVRGRTVFGIMPDGSLFTHVVLDNDSTEKCSVETLQSRLMSLGVQDALMLDNGGSSQWSAKTGGQTSPIYRCVSNLICIWGDVEIFNSASEFTNAYTRKEEIKMDTKKINVQLWTKSDALRNSSMTPKGIMVHSTATPGVSAKTFRDRWDRSGVGASVHYFVDNKDIIQCLPINKRAGHCAGSANSTHIAFEMCEPSGVTYNSSGSAIAAYNPPAGYFKAVWDNAVWLCARLCKEKGFNPMTDILSHAEGHAKGIASNHGDTAHWFKWENKTMDDFRKDVKAAMGTVNTDTTTTTTTTTTAPSTNTSYYSLTKFVSEVQAACGAKVDGVAGPETLSKTVTISASKNNRHAAVLAVQKRLAALGYSEVGTADGIAGSKFTAAVTRFQTNNGCWADGIITARNKTWKKLLGMA